MQARLSCERLGKAVEAGHLRPLVRERCQTGRYFPHALRQPPGREFIGDRHYVAELRARILRLVASDGYHGQIEEPDGDAVAIAGIVIVQKKHWLESAGKIQ